MPEGDWKQGRQFRVMHLIVNEGRQFKPETTFTAEAFGRVGCGGHSFALTDAQKRALLDVINWLDAPSKISPVLKRMIQQDPESPMIRPMIRVEMGIAPPKAETPTTAKGWMEFVEKTEPIIAVPPVFAQDGDRIFRRLERMRETMANAENAVPTTPVQWVATAATGTAAFTAITPPVGGGDFIAAQPERREEVAIRVRAHERVHGRTYFSRTDYYEGEMHVPVNVIQQGEDYAIDYIENHLRDYLDARYGEEEYGDSDIDESDGLVIAEHNIDRVIRGLRQDRPELFNEL